MHLPHVLTEAQIGRILPLPLSAEPRPQGMKAEVGCRIILSPDAERRAVLAAERLATLVREEFGTEWVIDKDARCPVLHILVKPSTGDLADLLAGAPTVDALPPEGYRLSVGPAGAALVAVDAQGLFWGAMTLRQLLLRHDGILSIPGVLVTDRPRYPWRGFQFDSGRAPNSLNKMKRIIRICSAFKLNFFIFREGDDELNAVRYKHLPLGSRNPCALTLDEIADLIKYADCHGITLIPEIESLGHSNAKGLFYPDLVSGGIETTYEGIGVHRRKRHLVPGDERSLALLEAIYREWGPLLPSPYLHLGLDEVLIDRAPQALHLERLLPMLERVGAEFGRDLRPIVWADAPPTPPAFAERVVRCLWAYGEHRGEGTVGLLDEHLVRQGIETLSSPRCSVPVLMAGGSGAKHTPYTKDSCEDAFSNLAEWARWGQHLSNFIGLFAVQWSGNMTDDWLPDFVTAADYAWRPPQEIPAYESQMARVSEHLERLKDYTAPLNDEVDPPAWDGIWLENDTWHAEILRGDGS